MAALAWHGLLALFFVVEAVHAWLVVQDAGSITDEALELRDRLVRWPHAEVLLAPLTIVATLAWLWRARTNADAIDPSQAVWARRWVILGWVVPVLSFGVPCSIVRSVWRASAPRGESTWPVGAWWAAFLVSTVSLQLAPLILQDPGDRHETFQGLLVWYVVLVLVWIAACLFAGMVVHRITRFQEAQAVRLAEAFAAGPEPVSDPA